MAGRLDNLLKDRQRHFWTLHIGGWLGYALLQYDGTLLSEHKNEALEVIKYLSQDQVQNDFAKLLGMFPARVEPQLSVGESSGKN